MHRCTIFARHLGGVLSHNLQMVSLVMAAKMLVIGGGFGAGICILLIDAIAVYRLFDDDVETAFARAVNESGPVLIVIGLAIALAASLCDLWSCLRQVLSLLSKSRA